MAKDTATEPVEKVDPKPGESAVRKAITEGDWRR